MKQAHNFDQESIDFMNSLTMPVPFESQEPPVVKMENRILRAKRTGKFNEYTILSLTNDRFAEIVHMPYGNCYATVFPSGKDPIHSPAHSISFAAAVKFVKTN